MGEAVRFAKRMLTTYIFSSRGTTIELQAGHELTSVTDRAAEQQDTYRFEGKQEFQARHQAHCTAHNFERTAQDFRSIQKRRSVRVYKTGKVSDEQLQTILEAARWAPSGANTQPWELVVTRDRKKMKRIREIYDNEWRQRKREDPVNYKGLKKDYVGDVSVIVLVCGDPRTKMVYLTTRQQADREKLFQASIANAVQQMM